jgi:hypothetical protein
MPVSTAIGSEMFPRATASAIAIDSPLVDSALRASGLESLRGIIRDWAIRGAFDAHYRIRGSGPDAPWRLTITPGAVQGIHAGRAFGMLVHSGTVEVGPAGVRAAGGRPAAAVAFHVEHRLARLRPLRAHPPHASPSLRPH